MTCGSHARSSARMSRSSPIAAGGRKRRARRIPADLLAWYDRHRRVLPWRARRGERRRSLPGLAVGNHAAADHGEGGRALLRALPGALADGATRSRQRQLDDVLHAWAGLGYYARARNLHACARAVVERHGGDFPDTAGGAARAARHRRLHRGGDRGDRVRPRARCRSTAISSAWSRGCLPSRSSCRRPSRRSSSWRASLLPQRRAGDFAQAMMDLGATICTPKRPACALCPWIEACVARARGDQETFPRKAPKREGKLRRGAAFVALRADGRVLLRTRPEKGLLGGMTEVPGSDWAHDFDSASALAAAPRLRTKPKWRRLPGVVTPCVHAFSARARRSSSRRCRARRRRRRARAG